MKFENDYIRIIIEKKQLTAKQKEERSLKRKKRRPAMIIALLLVAAMIGGIVYSRLKVPQDELQQASAGGMARRLFLQVQVPVMRKLQKRKKMRRKSTDR